MRSTTGPREGADKIVLVKRLQGNRGTRASRNEVKARAGANGDAVPSPPDLGEVRQRKD